MKGGGLKDSREGALCDSGSLAGDLAEECFGKRAFGTRICCSLWQRHSYLHPSAMVDILLQSTAICLLRQGQEPVTTNTPTIRRTIRPLNYKRKSDTCEVMA